MAEEAAQIQLDIARSDIRCLIVAGEPGGSVPAVRERLETAWGASVVDHSGATEVGPWGYADAARKGLHIVESEFIAEFVSRQTGRPAGDGELSELVLDNAGPLRQPGHPLSYGRPGRPTCSTRARCALYCSRACPGGPTT